MLFQLAGKIRRRQISPGGGFILFPVKRRRTIEVLFKFSGKEHRRRKAALIGNIFDRFIGQFQHSGGFFQTAFDDVLSRWSIQVAGEYPGQGACRGIALNRQFGAGKFEI